MGNVGENYFVVLIPFSEFSWYIEDYCMAFFVAPEAIKVTP